MKTKRLLSLLLTICVALSIVPMIGITVGADNDGVSYLVPVYNTEGSPITGIKEWKTEVCTSYEKVTSSTESVTWGEDGKTTWYVVEGDVTISKHVLCKGNVNLILKDGCNLDVTGGDRGTYGGTEGCFSAITVTKTESNEGNPTLTIYAQSSGDSMGALYAHTPDTSSVVYTGAGIGGTAEKPGRYITINGGKITAEGGYRSAGIGGLGTEVGRGGEFITINGGVVNAKGGKYAAGIGGSCAGQPGSSLPSAGSGENIYLNGGTITATGGTAAAGIGGGFKSMGDRIYVTGGTITATGGEGTTDFGGSGDPGWGIGSGADRVDSWQYHPANGIYFASTMLAYAGDSADSTAEVTHTGSDWTKDSVVEQLDGKRYVTAKPVPATGVTLQENAYLNIGSSLQLTATVAPSNAANKNVTWSSSDSGIVSVDSTGTIMTGSSAMANATATITATTVDGGYTDTCVVTISDNAYLYPEYNTSGDVTSGIKEWKTGTASNPIAVTSSSNATEKTWGTSGEKTWYIVHDTVDITNAKITVNGDVNLILADNSNLNITGFYSTTSSLSYPGIRVTGEGNSLTIYAQSTDASTMGKLTATGAPGCAGIGGKANEAGQNITINGGFVTASTSGGVTSGERYGGGAGIGAGFTGNALNITINGGVVNASAGSTQDYAGAGIGSSAKGTASGITINGGVVTATGGKGESSTTGSSKGGAGIGGNSSSEILVNGGTITATGGTGNCPGAGIGGSGNSDGLGRSHAAKVTITGDSISQTSITATAGGDYSSYTLSGICATNIYVSDSMLVKADATVDESGKPTTEISHANISTSISGKLNTLRYATIEEVELYSVSNGTPEEAESTNHGYVTIENDLTRAYAGKKITLIPTVSVYYSLETVYWSDGVEHAIAPDENGAYTFTMPAGVVTIGARFTDLTGQDAVVTVKDKTSGETVVTITTGTVGGTITLPETLKAGYSFGDYTYGDTSYAKGAEFTIPYSEVTLTVDMSLVIKTQPTATNISVQTDAADATYQWYECSIGPGEKINVTNIDDWGDQGNVYYWGSDKVENDTSYRLFVTGTDLDTNQVLQGEITSTGANYYDITPQGGIAVLLPKIEALSVELKPIVESNDQISGETSATLNSVTKGKIYYCCISHTYGESPTNSDRVTAENSHTHSWTYSLSADKKIITASCTDDCTYAGSDKSLTITVPTNLTYNAKENKATFGTATTFLGGTLPEITYEYKATEDGDYASTTDTVNAGYYKASFTVGEKTASVTYEIAKAAASLTILPIAAENLTYNGNAQKLISNTPTASDGTLYYAVGNTKPTETWTTTIPQETNAGTYIVWYKVVGDTNYTDISPAILSVTIAKANLTADDFNVIAPDDLDYSGTAKAASVETSLTGVGTVTVSYFSDEECETAATPTNANTYYVGISVAESTNYNAVALNSSTWKFEITRADQSSEALVAKSTTTTSITLKAVTGFGKVEYGISSTGSEPISWQDSPQFTGLEMNTKYYFFVKFSGDDNHNAYTSTATELSTFDHQHSWEYSADKNVITAKCVGENTCDYAKEDFTLTLTASDAIYDGKEHGATISESSIAGQDFLPTIEYYKGETKLEGAPAATGEYTAKITIGNTTAVKTFSIKANPQIIISGDDTARHTDVKSYTVSFEGDRPAGTTVVWDITGGTYEYIGDHIGTNSVSIICEDVGTLHITATLVDHAGRPVLNSDGEIVRATKDVDVKADSGNILNMIANFIRKILSSFSKLFG